MKIFAFVVLSLALALGIWSALPPGAHAHGPFSNAQAIADLQQIAHEPHPAGTAAHERVRAYVSQRMAALADEVANQNATAVRSWGRGRFSAVHVENLCARLNGDSSDAILLSAHYDSVPTAPGASDDGHGVAVLLQVMRALKNTGHRRNTVIFLASDAEEDDLFGAKAFVDEHPWRSQVRAVVNLEARGTSGADWMFRTGPQSGWLVDALARDTPYAQANSLSEEIFRFMPNDTDLTEMRRAGIPGLDFAYIGHPLRYHSMLDDVTHIDRDSLYQDGSNAIALLTYLENADLGKVHAPDQIYYGTGRTFLLHYPKTFQLPIAIAIAIALLLLVRRVALGRLALSAVAVVLLAAALATLTAVAESLLQTGAAGRFRYGYHETLWQAGFLCVAAAAVFGCFGALMRRTGVMAFWLGATTVFVLIVLAASVWMPGAAVSFSLGTAFILIAAAVYPQSVPVALVLVALNLFLFGQSVPALSAAVPEHSSAIVVGMLVLSFALLAPAIELLRKLWIGFALCGIALFVAASVQQGFDAQHPRPDSLVYALDADGSKAQWMSFDSSLDQFTTSVLGKDARRGQDTRFFPGWSGYVWKGAAPVEQLPVSSLKITRTRDGLDIDVIAGSGEVVLHPGAGNDIRGGSVDGRPLPDPEPGREPWISLTGNAGDHWSVHLVLKNWQEGIVVFDRAYDPVFPARPAGFMQRPFEPDVQIVRKQY